MEVNDLFNPHKIHRDDLRKIFDYRVALPAHRGEDLTTALYLVRDSPDLDFEECDVAHTDIGKFMIFGNPEGDLFYVALDSLGVRDIFYHRRDAAKYLSDRYRYLLALSIIEEVLMEEFGTP